MVANSGCDRWGTELAPPARWVVRGEGEAAVCGFAPDGDLFAYLSNGGSFQRLDHETGAMAWFHAFSSTTSCTVAGDRLIGAGGVVLTADGELVANRNIGVVGGGAPDGTYVSTGPDNAIQLELPDGTSRWRNEGHLGGIPAALLRASDGDVILVERLYYPDETKVAHLARFAAADGGERWRLEHPGVIAAAIAPDDTIWLLRELGDAYVVDRIDGDPAGLVTVHVIEGDLEDGGIGVAPDGGLVVAIQAVVSDDFERAPRTRVSYDGEETRGLEASVHLFRTDATGVLLRADVWGRTGDGPVRRHPPTIVHDAGGRLYVAAEGEILAIE